MSFECNNSMQTITETVWGHQVTDMFENLIQLRMACRAFSPEMNISEVNICLFVFLF